MNAARRKDIAKALALIAEAVEILSAVRDEEQGYFDNMPESLQSGEKGEAAEAAVSQLEEACDTLESLSLDDLLQ